MMDAPTCTICGKPATCFGAYEHPDDPEQFACDDCCGHGNDDGHCEPIAEAITNSAARLRSVEAQNEELAGRLQKADEWTDLLTRGKSPCGHWSAYAVTEDGGKHIQCLQCRADAAEAQLRTREAERWMRVQDGPAIPWRLIAPFDAQAQRNHGRQALDRLNERGGISVKEALHILKSLEWSYTDPESQRIEHLLKADAIRELQAIIDVDPIARLEAAEARCAALQAGIREEIAEHDAGPNAEYCWWCGADINGKNAKEPEPHDSNCWRVRMETLVGDPPAQTGASDAT